MQDMSLRASSGVVKTLKAGDFMPPRFYSNLPRIVSHFFVFFILSLAQLGALISGIPTLANAQPLPGFEDPNDPIEYHDPEKDTLPTWAVCKFGPIMHLPENLPPSDPGTTSSTAGKLERPADGGQADPYSSDAALWEALSCGSRKYICWLPKEGYSTSGSPAPEPSPLNQQQTWPAGGDPVLGFSNEPSTVAPEPPELEEVYRGCLAKEVDLAPNDILFHYPVKLGIPWQTEGGCERFCSNARDYKLDNPPSTTATEDPVVANPGGTVR